MRKRRVYVVAMGIALFAGVLALGLFREREPEYGGRSLSDWLDLLAEHYMDYPGERNREQAEDAIRHMGTKCIPHLLKWIASDPPTRGIFYRAGCAVIVRFHLGWQFPEDKHFFRELVAPQALALLGADAQATIPDLTKLLNDKRRPHNAQSAANALEHLGNAGLPPLLSILTNHSADSQLRRNIAFHREGISNPESASPALQHLLTDPDSTVRGCGTNAVVEIYPLAFEEGGPLGRRKTR